VRVLLIAALALVLAAPAAAPARPLPDGGGAIGPGRVAVDALARLGHPVYCGGGTKRLVALTFDDGPSPYTPSLLRVLRRAHARGTFFDVGSRLAYWPAAPAEQARLGEVGNHTWSHPHPLGLSRDVLSAEVELTEREGARMIGRRLTLFRPPYGELTPALAGVVRRNGLLAVLWSLDSGDSRPYASPSAVFRTVQAQVRPGSIVLLHDSHPWTADVARAVLRDLRRRHLRPVTVPELLAADPPRFTAGGRPLNDCR
jgi:peptidoglycan/xylan/chitin deacetylase (PgdA/CDA1 family)